MKNLTARQQEVFNFICQQVSELGRPPTRSEIAKKLGFRSANAAEDHLQALAKKQAIMLEPGTSRGIRIHSLYSSNEQLNLLPEHTIPLIGRVAAGQPVLAQQNIVKQYTLDPALFQKKPDYLLQVKGLSMKNIGMLEGDLIAIKRTTEVQQGQIVVARLNDEVTVKRFFRLGENIQLVPENENFETIKINPTNSNFAIEGIVIGLIRNSIFEFS